MGGGTALLALIVGAARLPALVALALVVAVVVAVVIFESRHYAQQRHHLRSTNSEKDQPA